MGQIWVHEDVIKILGKHCFSTFAFAVGFYMDILRAFFHLLDEIIRAK
jgi:hypothetical protein